MKCKNITKEYLYREIIIKKYTLSEVGRRFKVDSSTIIYWLNKFKIEYKNRESKYSTWTDKEKNILKEKYPIYGSKIVELHRPMLSINQMAKKLGLKAKSWSEKEIEFLKENYSTTEAKEIAERLGKTLPSIQHKIDTLNLKKQKNWATLQAIKKIKPLIVKDVEFANYICGFVAADGWFTSGILSNGVAHASFGISLNTRDTKILRKIKNFFGDGSIYVSNKRTMVSFKIGKIGVIIKKVIPFFREYSLRNTYKQRKFKEWEGKVYEIYKLSAV